MVLYGEALVAISLILGSCLLLFKIKPAKMAVFILVAGLLGGLFLNINFWLGFGWTSPAADSLNLLMAALEAIGIFFLIRQLREN